MECTIKNCPFCRANTDRYDRQRAFGNKVGLVLRGGRELYCDIKEAIRAGDHVFVRARKRRSAWSSK